MSAAGEGQHDALLTLSGGIDSTYALWKLLREGRRLLVLHVDLNSHEGRVRHEDKAVQRITRWLRGQGLHRFELVTAKFDYGTLGWITRDVEVIRFIAGVTLASPSRRHIDTVIASGIAEDPHLPDAEVARIRAILESAARRPIAIERPIRHMAKAEIIADMPPELFRLCWYCRKPQQGRTCGKCRTCKHVTAALKGAA